MNIELIGSQNTDNKKVEEMENVRVHKTLLTSLEKL